MAPSPIPTYTRTEAERQFWTDVQSLLTGARYDHQPQSAKRGIENYKQPIRERGNLGGIEAVYNQGEEKTAEVVNGAIETGLPQIAFR